MNAAGIQEILLSKPAAVLYECIILAVLITASAVFSKKRKILKKQREELLIQREKQGLDDALTNKQRRSMS